MSKFLKALEQAELDRALREQAQPVFARPVTDRLVNEGSRRPGPELALEFTSESPDGVEEHLVSLLTPTSFEAERYWGLRHLVEQLHRTADLCIMAVSSPGIGDGKTTTAINLAGALAQTPEAQVLLVDADLRNPAVVEYLGLDDPGPGLVDAILDPNLALKDVVRPCPPFNLSVIPARRRPSAVYEVLKSPRLEELLAEARRQYDYIVLDTAPMAHFPDCRVIGKWVDGFLVVVNAHRTPRKLVEEALNVTDQVKVIGLVFNGDDHPLPARYYAHPRWGDRAGGWLGQTVDRVRGFFQDRLGRLRIIRSSDG